MASTLVFSSDIQVQKGWVMEDNEEIKDDAPNATATATEGSNKNKVLRQSMETAYQKEAELEGGQLLNLGILKTTSGNVIKRLKTRQETLVATRASKNAATAIKQIAI